MPTNFDEITCDSNLNRVTRRYIEQLEDGSYVCYTFDNPNDEEYTVQHLGVEASLAKRWLDSTEALFNLAAPKKVPYVTPLAQHVHRCPHCHRTL